MALLEAKTASIPANSGASRKATAEEAAAVERRRMEKWLQDRIDQSGNGAVVEVVTLTPVLAELLLERNERNRPFSEVNLDRVKRDITAGRWEFNGESMIVSRDGKLNNGQHRAKAVVETGRSIPVVMVFGPPRESRMTLDMGVTRTVGHFLSMHGYHDANALGATAGYIGQYLERNSLSTAGSLRPTKSQTLMVVEHYKDIPESIDFVTRNGSGALASKSMLAFCHWAIWHRYPNAPREDVDEFFDKLLTGNELQKRDPILYCRNRLIETKAQWKQPTERAELIFRTWNAHRNNQRVDRIVVIGKELPKLEA